MRLSTLVLALALAACAPAKPDAPPVHIETSQVEPQIHWSSDLNGKRVSLDGYIGFDNGRDGQAIAIGQRLTTQPRGGGKQLMRLDLDRGEAPNQLNLPIIKTETMPGMPGAPEIITFDMNKATFQDAAGQGHPLSKKARVTGRLVYPRAGSSGLLSEEDSRSPTGRRFKPVLDDVTLELTPRR